MKYISLVFLLIAITWTWVIANNTPAIPESVHMGIQKDLKRVITEYIIENAPEVENVQFDHFWTQTLNPKQVKAVFSYTFNEGSGDDSRAASIGIEGYAILNQVADATGVYDLWNLDSLFVENNRIDFKEGLNIQTPLKQNKE